MPKSWLLRVLRIKDEHEVRAEIEREPVVRKANKAVELGDRVLAELEVLERRKRK